MRAKSSCPDDRDGDVLPSLRGEGQWRDLGVSPRPLEDLALDVDRLSHQRATSFVCVEQEQMQRRERGTRQIPEAGHTGGTGMSLLCRSLSPSHLVLVGCVAEARGSHFLRDKAIQRIKVSCIIQGARCHHAGHRGIQRLQLRRNRRS